MQFRTNVLYDGLYTFAAQSLNVVLAFGLGLLTARLLGPTGKGLYVLPAVQAGIVSAVFGGLTSTASYYLLNEGAGRGIVRALALVTAFFVACGSLVVVGLAFATHALWAAPAAIASLPAMAAICAVRGYVTGIKRIRYVANLSLTLSTVTLTLTAVALFLVARSAIAAVAAWVCAMYVVGAISWIAMACHARTLEPGRRIDLKRFASMALRGGATALVTLLNYRADVYIVAILLPPRELGLYSVATSAPQALLFPAQVAATVASPHIGGLDRQSAARLAARCARHSMLISLVICVAVWILAPFLIGTFYGDAFLPLVPSLRILLFGVVVMALAGPISSYYTLKLAKPEVPLALAGLSAAICISLTFVLIPQFGIAGAAVASTVAYAVGQGAALLFFRKGTGVGLRTMLLPTALDLRLYLDFAVQLRRDAARLLRA